MNRTVSIISGQVREPEFRKRTVPGASLFVPGFALEMMAEHADAGFSSDREVMGLMIGRSTISLN